MKLVIAEDDPTTLIRTATVLRALGCDVIEAADGEQAVAELTTLITENGGPDAVITDFQMPNRNGRELVEWMRSQDALKRTPVLMVSATIDAQQLGDLIGSKGFTFAAKPIDPVRMRDMVRSLAS